MTVTTERPAPPSGADDSPTSATPVTRGRAWRNLVPGLALILVVTLLLAVLGWAAVVGWNATLPEGAALRVDDENVTVADLDERDRTLQAIYGATPPADGPGQDGYRRDVAKSVAVSLVLAHAGAAQGIGVSDQQARALLDGFIQRNYPQGREAFVAALGQAGTSETAVLREVELQATTGQLFSRVTGGVPPVTDQDVRQAFDTGRASLVVPEQRRIRNIVLPSQAEADQLLGEARSGADFGSLVGRSLDASTRDTGGDLGAVPASALEKAYADAAFAAPRGGLFGPVQTRSGWNVGQVTDIVAPRQLSFDEVKDQLREKVATDRALAVWRDWTSEQIGNADVTYADDYRPADPDALPALSPAGTPDPTAARPAEQQPASGIGVTTILLSVSQIVIAALLFGIGRWGRRNADRLAPEQMPAEPRERRVRGLRRGAVACQVVAGLLVLVVAGTVLAGLLG